MLFTLSMLRIFCATLQRLEIQLLYYKYKFYFVFYRKFVGYFNYINKIEWFGILMHAKLK